MRKGHNHSIGWLPLILPVALSQAGAEAVFGSAVEKVQSAQALHSDKRALQSIGANIQQAELIVIGTVHDGEVVVKEVLQGDKSQVGKTIKCPAQRSICGPFLQASGKDQAVLFGKNWQAGTGSILESYQNPDQIAALRRLIPIFANHSEHERLSQLSKLCSEQGIYQQEFLTAIEDMREPANFAIVDRLYAASDAKFQVKLLEWIGNTGDKRALPILIGALKSPDRFVNSSAATKLIYYYPGAPGVDAAMLAVLKNGPDELKSAAYAYLSKRKPSAEVTVLGSKLPKPTTFQRAEMLRESGKLSEAVPLYLEIMESAKADAYVRLASALLVTSKLTADQKNKARIALLPMLLKDSTDGNYLEAADTAIIMRELHHIECLDSLIKLLDKREFIFDNTDRTATMAIRDLGAKARKRASRHLIQQVGVRDESPDAQARLFLSLAWFADDADLVALQSAVSSHPSWQNTYKQMTPFFALNKQQDEGKFLMEMARLDSLPRQAKFWAIYRLGDLKDKRAAALLLEELSLNNGDSLYIIDGALKSIGGSTIELGLEKIALNAKDESSRNAVHILTALAGARSLPVLRKVMQAKTHLAKNHALSALGRIGTPEDLKYLVPMSDYWQGDRANHYWLVQAISEIRQRYPAKGP